MTVSVWDSVAPDEVNATVGIAIADDLRAMVLAYDRRAPRSQQSDLGPSQIGMACVRCLARMSLALPAASPRAHNDPWCRIIGTATHAWLEQAACAANNADGLGRWHAERRVWPDVELLPSGGSCDLFDGERGVAIDHKIVGATMQRKYRAVGPGDQYRTQAHLYGLGYARQGCAVNRVAIAFWLRGGRLSDLYVWTEPFDETLARKALERYRTIRDTARTLGPALLPLLPADENCFECGGIDSYSEPASPASGSAA